MRVNSTFQLTSLALTVALLGGMTGSGCGGGGGNGGPAFPGPLTPGASPAPPPSSSSGRGQVHFSIRWPQKATTTRLIPQAARSIKFRCLEVDDDNEVITEKVVTRNDTAVTMNLPSVKVRIEAEARAEEDGSGQILAKGGVTIQVPEAQTVSEKLTLDSVIKEVRLNHTQVSLQPEQVVAVSANAYDETGAVVLTDPDGWEWTPDEPNAGDIVEFRRTGYLLSLKAKGSGTVTFTAKEKETGLTARLSVTSAEPSHRPAGLEVTPSSLKLKAGEFADFRGTYHDGQGNSRPVPLLWYGSDVMWGILPKWGKGMAMAAVPGTGVARLAVDDSQYVDVPVTVEGWLLTVNLHFTEGITDPAVLVYIDGTLIGKVTLEPNELGRVVMSHASAFPMELSPGPHTFKLVDVSGHRERPDAAYTVSLRLKTGLGTDKYIHAGESTEFTIDVPDPR